MTVLLAGSRRKIFRVPTGPQGGKGDPGGNVMAIGLFAAIATLTIPAGTTVVRTAGHWAQGVGVADYVEDSSLDDVYVAGHPFTSAKSANGRYWKVLFDSGPNDVAKFGIRADTTAQNGTTGLFNGTAADAAHSEVQSVMPLGTWLYWPQRQTGAYRFSAQPVYKNGVKWSGDGWHENPGIVAGVTYIGIQAYPGSAISYDKDVPGPIFYDLSDDTATNVTNDIALHGTASTQFKFQTARGTVLEDIFFFGGGGTNIAAHGAEFRTLFFNRNFRAEGFAGSGCKVVASSDTGTLPYGNADTSCMIRCRFRSNGMHGIHAEGRDVNVVLFLGCDTANNGGCNVYDVSFLGNYYKGHHCTTGNRSYGVSSPQRTQLLIDCPRLSDQYFGSVYMTSDVGSHKFEGYIENGTGSIGYAKLAHITGQAGSDTAWTADTTALVEGVDGQIWRGNRRALNKLGSRAVGFAMGVAGSTLNDAFAWGSLEEDPSGFYQTWRMGLYGNDGDHSWHLNYGGTLFNTAFQFPTALSSWHTRGGAGRFAPAFINGYFLNGSGFGPLPVMYRGFAAAMPTSGGYTRGDYIANTAPAITGTAGSQYVVKGWTRLTTGSAHVLNADWAEDRALTGT